MPRNDIMDLGGTETLVPLAARTTSGNGGVSTGWGSTSSLRVQLEVTAVSGTNPSDDVFIEDTLDGTNWNIIGTFQQALGVGFEVINITTPFSDKIRVRWEIAGTDPSVTFTVLARGQ